MADLDHKRADRVGPLLQQELAALIDRDLKDPRVGFVTVTEVRVSADVRYARVFVSVYGTEQERTASIEGLRAASGFLKRELGRRMRLRRMPELTFELDRGLDRAQRLDDLLKAAEQGELEAPAERETSVAKVSTRRSDLADTSRVFDEMPPPQGRRPAPGKGGRAGGRPGRKGRTGPGRRR